MKGSRSIIGGAIAIGLLAGSTVAVAAQGEADIEPVEPVPFTARFVPGPEVRAQTVEEVDGRREHRDVAWAPTVTASDPRLEGTLTFSADEDRYEGESGTFTVGHGTYRIENAAGAWQGSQLYLEASAPEFDAAVESFHGPVVLSGEGAYEGLYAVFELVADWDDIKGVILPAPPPEAAIPASIPETVAFAELRVADVAELDERTRDLTIESPSVGEVKVRLLLPPGFHEDPDATYPVLYLLHGAWDDYTSWTRETDVEELTADLPLLVVMPDGGREGFYTDWWNEGDGGPPAWETFHLSEVRDILERDWRASDERVIAGLSMGGYGAMHYATAHPDLFEAAAAFSGVLDPVGADFSGSYELWGDREEQAENWAAHDPVAMAEALRGKPLYVSWQDGQPGPLDSPGTTAESYDLEAWVAPQNEAFVARLEELGIPVTTVTGSGAHEWPYWEQGLHDALPMLLKALEE
jgi:S-formylglutathione hydrolase FrmB